MEIIKNWAFSVCISAICGAIINMILPEGSAQKTYKAVFCIFFLSVIVAPLSEIEIPDFDFLANNIESIDIQEIGKNNFNESYVSVIEKAIIDDTKTVLTESGITAKDIFIKINISENGSIDINKFTLIFESLENIETIKENIYKKTGVTPEIIVSEEN